MPVAVDKLVLIGALTVGILFLMIYGWNTCMDSQKEGFTNPVSSSTAPTRASDCRCLPGYIPSNTGGNNLNGKFIKYINEVRNPKEAGILYNPNNTNNYYLVTVASIQDFDKMYESFTVCNKKLSKYPISRTIDNIKELIKKIENEQWNISYELFGNEKKCNVFEQNSNLDSTYFCQSLSNSQTTKSCY
jgi:hypothetical protein